MKLHDYALKNGFAFNELRFARNDSMKSNERRENLFETENEKPLALKRGENAKRKRSIKNAHRDALDRGGNWNLWGRHKNRGHKKDTSLIHPPPKYVLTDCLSVL